MYKYININNKMSVSSNSDPGDSYLGPLNNDNYDNNPIITNDKYYSSSDEDDIKKSNKKNINKEINEITENDYNNIDLEFITENVLIKILYNINFKRLNNEIDWIKILSCVKYINLNFMYLWCEWLKKKIKIIMIMIIMKHVGKI